MVLKIKKIVANYLVKHYEILCYLMTLFIGDNKNSNNKLLRLFVMDEKRFREDIGELRLSLPDIDFIRFSNKVQDKVTGVVLNSSYSNNEEKIIIELSFIIKEICKLYDVSGFISAGFRYRRHDLWERAALSVGVKFFCLYREGVGLDDKALNENYSKRIPGYREFNGTCLMVGTSGFKKMLYDKGYRIHAPVIVTGLPRFDKVFNYVNSKNDQGIGLKKKTLLMFSFFIGTIRDYDSTGLYPESGGFNKLFYSVHAAVARFAIENPDVNVYIKPKWYVGKAKKSIDRAAYYENNIKTGSIDNLIITDKIPAQTLMKMADTVVGFNSTTLIESLLYGKKVIMPVYYEATGELQSLVSNVDFKKDLYMPTSEGELLSMINDCMNNELPPTQISKELISQTIGYFDGNVCHRISDVLTEYS
jgi:hypothetical protein